MNTENQRFTEGKAMEFEPLLAAVNSIVGKKVRVTKADGMDDACRIAEHLRWHVGDEMIVRKVEILPWGCFLYDGEGHNLDARRAELVV